MRHRFLSVGLGVGGGISLEWQTGPEITPAKRLIEWHVVPLPSCAHACSERGPRMAMFARRLDQGAFGIGQIALILHDPLVAPFPRPVVLFLCPRRCFCSKYLPFLRRFSRGARACCSPMAAFSNVSRVLGSGSFEDSAHFATALTDWLHSRIRPHGYEERKLDKNSRTNSWIIAVNNLQRVSYRSYRRGTRFLSLASPSA